MSTFCDFEKITGTCVCSHCGTPAKSCAICDQCRRKCRSENDKLGDKLGDKTEKLLKTIGITPDLVKACKQRFGLAPTCNCNGRKEYLNRVSDWFAEQVKK